MSNTKNILAAHHRRAVMQSDWWKAKFIYCLLKERRAVISGFEWQKVAFYSFFGEQFGLHHEQVKGEFRFEFYFK